MCEAKPIPGRMRCRLPGTRPEQVLPQDGEPPFYRSACRCIFASGGRRRAGQLVEQQQNTCANSTGKITARVSRRKPAQQLRAPPQRHASSPHVSIVVINSTPRRRYANSAMLVTQKTTAVPAPARPLRPARSRARNRSNLLSGRSRPPQPPGQIPKRRSPLSSQPARET